MRSTRQNLAHVWILSFLLCGCVAAAPFQTTADRPGVKAAEQRTKELVDVLNTGSADKVREYVRANFAQSFLTAIPVEQHVEILSRSSQRHGGFEIAAVTPVSSTTVAANAKSRKTGEWFRVVLDVEPEAPYKIASIGITRGGPPADPLPAGEVSDDQIVESLRKFVEKAAADDRFSGAVLLAKADQVLFKGAYGEACKRFKVPNRVDTKFNLGSMNKMFTAVAIAQLAERGKLSFDDPLSKYLTGWVPAEAAEKIKIRHLLTHTSGLGSYFNDKFEKSSRLLYRNVNDYKPLVADEKLAFEPGTKWQYSNTGFLLLGAVIEKVTGQSYFDYIRENIYKPAGMVNSDSYEMDVPVANLAIGYDRDQKGQYRENTMMHVVKGGPAGGGFSTVEDLHRFALALHGGKLLSPKYRDLVTTPKPELNSPEYGYGFQVEKEPEMIGHGGGFPGISSRLSIYTKDGYALAVLSNYSGGSFDILSHVRGLVFAKQ